MLYEEEDFESGAVMEALGVHNGTFRYCTFASAHLAGGDFGDLYAYCHFRNLDVESCFFHFTLFHNCTFEHCTFRGTSFGGCRFLQCTFVDCRFSADDAGSPCDAPDARLFSCSAIECEGWEELFTERIG